MTALTVPEIIDLLADLDQRCREHGEQPIQEDTHREIWQGLAFSLAGVKVVADMGEISELLYVPDVITPVPGAKEWIRGLANVRGNLLPIVDLQGFLGGRMTVPNKETRLLVVRMQELTAGLMVTSVIGMRHFDLEQSLASARIEGSIGPYVRGAFQAANEIWPVFSFEVLVKDEKFASGAA